MRFGVKDRFRISSSCAAVDGGDVQADREGCEVRQEIMSFSLMDPEPISGF